MLERIWSGWRSSYVSDAPSRLAGSSPANSSLPATTSGISSATSAEMPSVFTQLLESGEPDDATHIVHRGELVFVVVNIFPYTSGHQLVLPYREVADITDLTPAETAELWSTVTTAVSVVRSAYSPDGVNVGLNIGRAAGGTVPTHLHVHVVPRWTGDSNFLSAIANTQTLPEALDATTERLRVAWAAAVTAAAAAAPFEHP